MFAITGDSWACGSWGKTDPNSSFFQLSNRGLSECMNNKGIKKINLGLRGAGNLAILEHITNWLEQNPQWQPQEIFFFLTDYTRDIPIDTTPNGHEGYWISLENYYSDIARRITHIQQVCPVWLIGGLSDVPTQLMDTVPVVCQSFTNLLFNDNPNIDDPVLSVYMKHTEQIVEIWHKNCQGAELESFVKSIEQGHARFDLFKQHQRYFFPDKTHPNLSAHAKLFWHIKQKLKFLG